jgi:hypothetical protein
MGLALAFKRVGRTYRVPQRRFAKGTLIYALGFWAGIASVIHYSHLQFAAVSEWFQGILIAILLVIWGIQLAIHAPLPDQK